MCLFATPLGAVSRVTPVPALVFDATAHLFLHVFRTRVQCDGYVMWTRLLSSDLLTDPHRDYFHHHKSTRRCVMMLLGDINQPSLLISTALTVSARSQCPWTAPRHTSRHWRPTLCRVVLTDTSRHHPTFQPTRWLDGRHLMKARIVLYWHCPYSMRSRIYETVLCPSVCPSLPAWTTAAIFGPAGRRYRLIAAQRTAARRAVGECGQCHVVSVFLFVIAKHYILLAILCRLSTLWVKKTRYLTLVHNFTKYWPIFKLLSLLDSAENL